MSLATDISAPAALSPLLASGPAVAPVQVVNGAGFAEALTQAQTGVAPEVVLPEAMPALPETPADLLQAIGADAVVSHRQSFVPVHGMAEFPAAANIDAHPLQAAPALTGIAAVPEPVEAEAQAGAAAPVALSKLAALKPAAAKPAVARAEANVAEDMAVETLPLPTVAGVGPAAVTQPVPDALPVAQTDSPSPVGAKAMPREAVAAQEVASSPSPDAALPPFDAASTRPAPEPLAQPAGDLRAALSALRRLDDMDHGAEAAAQPVPDAPVTGIAPQDEAAAIADLAPDSTDTAPDPLHAEIGGAVSEAASSAPQNQPAAPVITPQLGPMAETSVPVPPSPVHPALRMDQPDWPEKLAIRLAGAFDANEANIEMQLSPEHLGPLHIRLEMKSGVAQVFVTTATPQAAEAFARAETQLSGLLAAADVTLTGQETAQGGFADQGGQGGYHGARAHPVPRFHPDTTRTAAPEASAQRLLNLIA